MASRKNLIPRALKRLVDAQHGGDQDIDVSRFDLLDGAQIQIRQFREPFLRHAHGHPLPANIRAEQANHWLLMLLQGHALLGRIFHLTGTAH